MVRQLGAIREGSIKVGQDWLHLLYAETEVDSKRLRYVQTNRLAAKRLQTLFTKEPTTILWLESFSPDEVFVDIGANVGLYSVYAAVMRSVRVFAFEPEALNYAELNKNIYVNDLHGRVLAYCLALSGDDRVASLLLGGFAEGLSHHDFGENTWSEDKKFGPITTSREKRLEQGSVGIRLDTLVEQHAIPMPNHIKIDVDGLEHRVVEGGWQTFQKPGLRSVLIEIDHRIPHCRDIVDKMQSIGWRYSVHQVRANRKKLFSPQEIERMRDSGIGGFNYIFYKESAYDRLFEEYIENYVPPMIASTAQPQAAFFIRLLRKLRQKFPI